jgi:D-glycero-D-manno-heptose 1,7-bisphosphate phosphatase
MRAQPAVFLDRDGVIIDEVNYLSGPEQVRLIPGAAEAIARLNQRGIPVVVVTNQSGVARGLFPEEGVAAVHEYLSGLLAAAGAHVSRYYYCPHHPTAGRGAYGIDCLCRKPRPGMLLRAAAEMGLDLGRSFLVGDKRSDLEAGARAGARTILVRTGYGQFLAEATLDCERLRLAAVTADLAEAVQQCLARMDGPRCGQDSTYRNQAS